MSYLPSLVDRSQIIEGNSKLQISQSAAQISGPGIGGLLVEIFTAPYAVLVDAASYLGSALFLVRIRATEAPTETAQATTESTSIRVELKEGLRFVFANPNLRAQAGCTATSNFFSNVAFAIYLVFAVRELALSPGVIGASLSIGAVGSLVGAVTAMRFARRFGIGTTTIVSAALFGPGMLLLALPPAGNSAIPFLVAGLLLMGFAIVVYNIVQVSYRQAICPPRLQGRMNSVMRFVVWGTIPVGSLVGGALASWIGLRETIVVGAIGGGLSVLWIVFSPQRHLREMPEPMIDAVPEPAGT